MRAATRTDAGTTLSNQAAARHTHRAIEHLQQAATHCERARDDEGAIRLRAMVARLQAGVGGE